MNNKSLNICLWVAQGLLAVFMLMGGFMKLTMPIAELSKILAWTGSFPEMAVRGIGILDAAGGIGILLPSLLRIKPNLTPLAAICIIVLMVSAIIMHVSRGEASVIGFNFVLIALAGFVYWGRTQKVQIVAK